MQVGGLNIFWPSVWQLPFHPQQTETSHQSAKGKICRLMKGWESQNTHLDFIHQKSKSRETDILRPPEPWSDHHGIIMRPNSLLSILFRSMRHETEIDFSVHAVHGWPEPVTAVIRSEEAIQALMHLTYIPSDCGRTPESICVCECLRACIRCCLRADPPGQVHILFLQSVRTLLCTNLIHFKQRVISHSSG